MQRVRRQCLCFGLLTTMTVQCAWWVHAVVAHASKNRPARTAGGVHHETFREIKPTTQTKQQVHPINLMEDQMNKKSKTRSTSSTCCSHGSRWLGSRRGAGRPPRRSRPWRPPRWLRSRRRPPACVRRRRPGS